MYVGMYVRTCVRGRKRETVVTTILSCIPLASVDVDVVKPRRKIPVECRKASRWQGKALLYGELLTRLGVHDEQPARS